MIRSNINIIIKITKPLMNKNSRILPHLNVCFLQKKAYDVHRKKIEYIKSSLRNSLLQKSHVVKDNSHDNLAKYDSSNRMSTIKEQVSQRHERQSPYVRRRLLEKQKENFRLIKRIQSCSSTINRKDIQRHMVRSKEIKDRLCKFKYNSDSKTTELKSVNSLLKLQKIKERDYDETNNHSRQFSYNRSRAGDSKSMLTQISRISLSSNSEDKSVISKKDSLERLMVRRNIKKINVHFGKDEFVTRAKERLDALRQGNSTDIQRRKQSEPIAGYWKSRCFTTQIDSYN